MQCLKVPIGRLSYWTVVDADYRPVPEVDSYLRHARLGLGRAEGTTKMYAGALAEFWAWKSVRDLLAAARDLDMFVMRVRTEPIVSGRSVGRTRSPQRVNGILVAVREFYKHAAAHGSVDASVLGLLYEVTDDGFLPAHLRPEGGGLAYVARPRHRLRASRPSSPVGVTVEELEALLAAASCARDRLLIALVAVTGVRIGGALALRRSDVHLAERSRTLGCDVAGPHLHIPPADSFPGAATKGDGYTALAPAALLLLFEMYAIERDASAEARASDWLFVNRFGPNPGSALGYQTVYELFVRLSRRAGLDRSVTPHMLRHGLASDLVDQGVHLAVIQRVLGQRSIVSAQVYARPSAALLRSAVDAGARRLPRTMTGER